MSRTLNNCTLKYDGYGKLRWSTLKSDGPPYSTMLYYAKCDSCLLARVQLFVTLKCDGPKG